MRIIHRVLVAAALCMMVSMAEYGVLVLAWPHYPALALLLFFVCATLTGVLIGRRIGSMETLWKVLDGTALPPLDEH